MASKIIKIIYKPPEKMTEDMERGLERAYSVLFEAVMRDRQLKTIKSQIKMNYENEYKRISK